MELATTENDNRGVGSLSAAVSALVNAAASVVVLWVLGGLIGFFLSVVTGVFAVIFGLRARRAAAYSRNRSWWLGTAAIVITVVSLVGCLTYNVLVPDKSRDTGPVCTAPPYCAPPAQ
jgi:uncharacterized membrane protein (UPF0136 family)